MNVGASVRRESRELQVATRFQRRLKKIVTTAIIALVGMTAIEYYLEDGCPVGQEVRNAVAQQNRVRHSTMLTYEEIPVLFRNAILATEDQTFMSNPGIDPKAILRSAFVDAQSGQFAEGGSTITQQLVRNALGLSQDKSLSRKVTEAVDAVALTKQLSKEEIFALYTNDIYFGHNAYGLYNAAETYFGMRPQQLNDGELTLLAGLPNAPSAYDPFHSLPLAQERQRKVVRNMVNAGFITSSDALRILSEPIRLKHGSQ
jgi:monofunctional glycosyltransferase